IESSRNCFAKPRRSFIASPFWSSGESFVANAATSSKVTVSAMVHLRPHLLFPVFISFSASSGNPLLGIFSQIRIRNHASNFPKFPFSRSGFRFLVCFVNILQDFFGQPLLIRGG